MFRTVALNAVPARPPSNWVLLSKPSAAVVCSRETRYPIAPDAPSAKDAASCPKSSNLYISWVWASTSPMRDKFSSAVPPSPLLMLSITPPRTLAASLSSPRVTLASLCEISDPTLANSSSSPAELSW